MVKEQDNKVDNQVLSFVRKAEILLEEETIKVKVHWQNTSKYVLQILGQTHCTEKAPC